MNILPSMSMKSVADCQRGELVRLAWGQTPLALIAKYNDEPFEIILQDGESVGSAPRFFKCNADSPPVISLGTDYDIEIDPIGPHEMRPRRLYELNGAILVHGSQILMRVAPARGIHIYASTYIDLRTGQLADGPNGQFATFAHWQLFLQFPHTERRFLLVKFNPELSTME